MLEKEEFAADHTAETSNEEETSAAGCAEACRTTPAESKPISARADKSKEIRVNRAGIMRSQPLPPNSDTEPLCNCEEKDYTDFPFAAMYSKGLKHLAAPDNKIGEVNPDSYRDLLEGLKTKTVAEFDNKVFRALGCTDKSAEEKDAPAESFVQQNIQVSAVDNQVRLVNPLAAQAFDLQGIDSHQVQVFEWDATVNNLVKVIPFPKPPRFDSADEIAEMAEIYWMALARDIPFVNYEEEAQKGNSVIKKAIDNLNKFNYFRNFYGNGASVNAGNLFRGRLEGDLVGPYLSQFLVRPVPYAAFIIDPRIRTVKQVSRSSENREYGGLDYMITLNTEHPKGTPDRKYGSWLDVQNGCVQPGDLFDKNPALIMTGRDMGQYVHVDSLFEQYVNACQILQVPRDVNAPIPGGLKVPQDDGKPNLVGGGLFRPRFPSLLNDGNPYRESKVQQGFGTLGIPDVKVLIAEAAKRALKAAWYQKWSVHRRLRPEEFAGRIDVRKKYERDYPFNPNAFDILEREVLPPVFEHNRNFFNAESYLLPMAFPEGSPQHPAYPQGHATVAGACVTILKAFFNDVKLKAEGVTIIQPTGENTLSEYTGTDAGELTVHGELNKLASNVGLGRDFAGVHWRTDYENGLRLGEAVAVWLLCDIRSTYSENFSFTFKPFFGSREITISKTNKNCFARIIASDTKDFER